MTEVEACDRDDALNVERQLIQINNKADWIGSLLTVVARNNGVRVVGLEKNTTGKRYAIFGAKHEVQIVIYLYNYLQDILFDLADEAWDNSCKSTTRARYQTGYYFGAITTINERMLEKRKQHLNESKMSQSLIVVSQARTDAEVAKWYPKLSSRKLGPFDNSGYTQGRSDARNIGIHDGLTGANNSARSLNVGR